MGIASTHKLEALAAPESSGASSLPSRSRVSESVTRHAHVKSSATTESVEVNGETVPRFALIEAETSVFGG